MILPQQRKKKGRKEEISIKNKNKEKSPTSFFSSAFCLVDSYLLLLRFGFRIMPWNRFMGPLLFNLLISFSFSPIDSASLYNTYPVSSFSYPETKLKPFEWRYVRGASTILLELF